MSPRSTKLLPVMMLAALAAGCPKPPPVVPPPDPAAEPPPPPKCESVSEKCQAKPTTAAKITGVSLAFTPALGWIYAQMSSATIAQASETGPAIAFMGFDGDPKDAKKDAAARDTALGELAKQLGLAPLKRKVNWKKPDEAKTIGTMKIGLWQLEEAQRGPRKGPLLLVVGATGDGTKELIGVGFVPDTDNTQADAAIMRSIESLRKAQ